jgi:hypothetical protein
MRQLFPTQYYGSVNTLTSTTGLLAPTSISRALETDAHLVSMYNMTFGIQRSLDSRTMLDLAYSGNLGRHLGQTRQLNTIPYGARFLNQNLDPTTGKPLSDTFLRPYYGYGNTPYLEFAGTSNYPSLQAQVKRSLFHDLQYGMAWTWSKAMDYGAAGYDRAHSVVADWVWEAPCVSRYLNHAVTRFVLDNWQVCGIVAFVSGSPRGITLSLADGADLTGGGDRTSVVKTGSAVLPKSGRTFSRYFDTSVFERPALGSAGSGAGANRYAFRGPGIKYDRPVQCRRPALQHAIRSDSQCKGSTHPAALAAVDFLK